MRTTASIVLAAIWGVTADSGYGRAQPAAPASHLAQPANGPRRADPTWHALRDVTVHVKPGVQMPHATVVIRNGTIQAVLPAQPGPDGKLGTDDDVPASIPMGPRVWDLSGQHVYAGFIDPYIEVDAPLPDLNAAGAHWSPRVMPQRRATDGKGIEERDAETLRKLGFTAAAVAPKRGIFRGRSSVVSLAVDNPDLSQPRPPTYAADVYQTIAFDLSQLPSNGAPEDHWPGYPDSEMGAIALIRQTLIDADWQSSARASHALIAPNALDALGSSAEGSLPLYFSVSDELETLRAAKIAREFKRRAVIVGSGTEYQRLDAIKGDALPIIVPLVFPDAPDVSTLAKSESVELSEMTAWEQAPTNIRRVDAAGLTVALTTARLEDRSKFSGNLARAVRYGLDPERALAMLTTTPAGMLGVADRMGTVETGKLANLVVSDKPLLAAEKSPPQKNRKEKKPTKDEKNPETKLVTKPDANAGSKPDPKSADVQPPAETKPDANAKEDKAAKKIEGGATDPEPQGQDKKDQKHKKTDDDAAPVIRQVWIDGLLHEINAAPVVQLAGSWALTFDPPRTGVCTLDIDDKNVITVKIADAYTTADKVALVGNRLGFVYDTSEFDGNGTAVVNAIAEKNTTGEVTLYGELVNPDSTRQKWTAKKAVPSTDAAAPDKPAFGSEAFFGSWKAFEFDGRPGPDNDPNAPTIVFGGDGIVLIQVGDKQAHSKGTYGKREDQGKTRLEYIYDSTPLGSAGGTPGDWEDKVTIENGVLVGESKTPTGKLHTFKAKRVGGDDAKQDAARPPRVLVDAMTGVYLIVTINDAPVEITDDASSFVIINADGTALLKGRGTEIIPGDIKVERDRVSYTVDFSGVAAKGNDPKNIVRVEARRFNDFLIGTMASPDGTIRSWKGVRVAASTPAKNETILKDAYYDDLITIASIPEAVTYPFGPYGLSALPPQHTVIVKNATIWTSGPAGIINNASLVVAGGKISQVAAGDLSGLVDAKDLVIIDAAGKHITPGIIDCHSHTGISRGVNEGGQAVTAEVRIEDVTDPDAIDWYRELAGGVTTVNNLHGSANVIGGQNCVNKIRWGVANPDQMHFEGAKPGIKFALGENPKASNWGDNATTRYPQTRMGVEGLLRDRFTIARDYISRRNANAADFHRDLELDAIAEILENKRLVHCHSYRQDEILMLCRLSQEFGFKIGTFQHCLEGYKVADAIKDAAVGASLFADWWAYKVEVQDAIPQAGPIMTEVGVPVSYNSDSDELARRMNTEAAKAVRYGNLAPAEALKYVTINPAIQLDISARVGSLEVGKDADFVIWSAQPLSVAAKCEATYIDGREYFSLAQDKAHRERIAKERTRLIQKALGAFVNEQLLKSKLAAMPQATKPTGDSSDSVGDGLSENSLDGSGTDSRLQALTDEALRAHYLDLYNRGISPLSSRPGVCGCGMVHQR